jgi:hypothetical protein
VANDVAIPSTPNATLDAHDASTSANDSLALLADIASTELIDEATLADDGRYPIEEASVDASEPFAMEEPPTLTIPLVSSIPNEGSASIDVLVPIEAEDEVTLDGNADELFDNFMEDVDEVEDVDEPTHSAANVDIGMEETHGAVDEVATNTPLTFKDEYAKSIQPVMAKVDSLFARSMWSGVAIATHPPASDDEQEKLLAILRKISPSIGDRLHIDSSNIKKHPEIQKVLDNHSRGSAYFRQFFKRPLVAECDCVACREGIFSPMIMPVEAYTELHEKYAMPLSIPKPTVKKAADLHYMSFEEAVTKSFTDEHQPSLQNRRRNNNIVDRGGHYRRSREQGDRVGSK